MLKKKAGFPVTINTTCNRNNENAGFPVTINTTCNRSNENAGFPDTTTVHAEEGGC